MMTSLYLSAKVTILGIFKTARSESKISNALHITFFIPTDKTRCLENIRRGRVPVQNLWHHTIWYNTTVINETKVQGSDFKFPAAFSFVLCEIIVFSHDGFLWPLLLSIGRIVYPVNCMSSWPFLFPSPEPLPLVSKSESPLPLPKTSAEEKMRQN
jgi:hypothetical protein